MRQGLVRVRVRVRVCVCVRACARVCNTRTGSFKNNVTVSHVHNEASSELTMTKYLSTVG
jgi:hypothetical protein